jgi:hypothetical protein
VHPLELVPKTWTLVIMVLPLLARLLLMLLLLRMLLMLMLQLVIGMLGVKVSSCTTTITGPVDKRLSSSSSSSYLKQWQAGKGRDQRY